MRFIFKLILIIFITLFYTMAIAQNPVLREVSVINENGHVRLSWDYSGSETLGIFRDNQTLENLSLLASVGPSIKTYTDTTARADINPRLYKIQSVTTSSVKSDVVTTYHITHVYDSCTETINLKWKDLKILKNGLYSNWTPKQFTINSVENGITTKATVSASTLEYNVQNIKENTEYTLFVQTSWNESSSISSSNLINKFTEMPQSPAYINSLSASANGADTELRFDIDPSSELNTYKLFKSDAYNGNYNILETFNISNFEITATDLNSEPDNKISYYKLISYNVCGNERTNSDIINNIALTVENSEFINSLLWNRLKEQDLVYSNYDIYRISNNMNPKLIGTFPNFNKYSDNVENLQGEQYSGEFCYFIRAREENAPTNIFTQSNIVCVYLNPKVYIPEAFTPNDDGINDFFIPQFTFLPTQYSLRIFNRWGNLVFESEDPSETWDGTGLNNKKVPTGAYIYYFKINTKEFGSVEKNGSVIVLYP